LVISECGNHPLFPLNLGSFRNEGNISFALLKAAANLVYNVFKELVDLAILKNVLIKDFR